MNKVFSFLMVTFAMVTMMTSCDKDKDKDKNDDNNAATSTYKGYLELSDKGDLKSLQSSNLNILFTLFSEVDESASTYKNVKPDDAKAAFSQKIEELASKYAQDYPSNTFTITAQLKDTNNNNNIIAEWVISCKNGVGEVEQK